MATNSGSFTASSSHEPSSFTATSLPNEFYVTVDLYLSKITMAARKYQIPRRKTEKRDIMRSSVSSGDLHQRKIKEKASWLGLSRGSSNAEQWRSATCKLVEEDEGCLLNVYIDDTALYQSIYVHKLYHTDIRRVHHSLFDRKDCLGIFCTAEQTWNATAFSEPLYLHFADTEILNTWIVLLRSYAMPEVYGRWLSVHDGGLYQTEAKSEGDSMELDIYCEFWVNGIFTGKTTTKKGLGSPDWHEKFAFNDLPPFEHLEIMVYRERRVSKPMLVGTTQIPLMNFRRGEYVEGWFPVLGGPHTAGIMMGEVRLKLKVDEEIILPYAMYDDMLKVLLSKNMLDWVSELDAKLEIKNISDHLIAIAKAKNILMKDIMALADREVDGTPQSHGTLFRGNTVFTKTMEIFMVTQGAAFLEASVGTVIRRLCTEKVAIEIDPARNHKKNIDKNADLLVFWCQEFWKSIYEARKHCPDDMRKLFSHIRQLIESRYEKGEGRNADLPWQGVSSFLFLRFFVPAILHPHLFGIWPGLTEDPVQRTLTLIAKVMQSLANLNTSLQKEQYMRPVQEFLTNSSKAMIEYIGSVSSADPTVVEALPSQVLDRHEKGSNTTAPLHGRLTQTSGGRYFYRGSPHTSTTSDKNRRSD
ncbi:hypothetical protein NM688_g6971 [Phlebia brevispora]|uniref:Uncharacterized protein n=1 Tax=Phlebia brevispora TaxID=194682 RepID=A0ACC1SAP5_9APHY|nr:hypothetical protein NM688_g6971 [Phlebia brevispora]